MKCFHNQHGTTHGAAVNNWPVAPAQDQMPSRISVEVAVNGRPVPITASHREVYLQTHIRPGVNKLTITVSQCCCVRLRAGRVVAQLPLFTVSSLHDSIG